MKNLDLNSFPGVCLLIVIIGLMVLQIAVLIAFYRSLRTRGLSAAEAAGCTLGWFAVYCIIRDVPVLSALWWPATMFWVINSSRSEATGNLAKTPAPGKCGQCGISLRPGLDHCHFCQWQMPAVQDPAK